MEPKQSGVNGVTCGPQQEEKEAEKDRNCCVTTNLGIQSKAGMTRGTRQRIEPIHSVPRNCMTVRHLRLVIAPLDILVCHPIGGHGGGGGGGGSLSSFLEYCFPLNTLGLTRCTLL